jgi:hypothetical protein
MPPATTVWSGHMIMRIRILGAAAAIALLSGAALAQAPKQQAQSQTEPQPQAQPQQPVVWERMQRMQLEAEYAGPLKDTTIQRWRDPFGDVVCYLYIPFTAQHSPPTPNGYVQYGSNTIGSISCLPELHPTAVAAKPAAAKSAAAKPPAPASPPRPPASESPRQP